MFVLLYLVGQLNFHLEREFFSYLVLHSHHTILYTIRLKNACLLYPSSFQCVKIGLDILFYYTFYIFHLYTWQFSVNQQVVYSNKKTVCLTHFDHSQPLILTPIQLDYTINLRQSPKPLPKLFRLEFHLF